MDPPPAVALGVWSVVWEMRRPDTPKHLGFKIIFTRLLTVGQR